MSVDHLVTIPLALLAGVYLCRLIRRDRRRLAYLAAMRQRWDAMLEMQRIILLTTQGARDFSEHLNRVGEATRLATPAIRRLGEALAATEEVKPK